MELRLILRLMVILAVSGASTPAQVPAPDEQGSIYGSRTARVLVPALVRDSASKVVYTLHSDDFVLTDDGIPKKLTLEADTGNEPLALVVVVEVGGAGAREFEKLGPLAPMLESVVGNVRHEVAVVAFDSEPSLVQRFTSRIDAAARAIVDLTPGCSRQHHAENCEAPGSFHDRSDADNGAAILDSLGYAVDLLRSQPLEYRRAILLVSETLDRGSKMKLEDAVRALNDANTTIYSIGFSTGKSEAAHYGYRELPGSHRYPNPPHGCMGKDPIPDPDATQNEAVQAYDCLTQLAPPLALAKMAAIVVVDGLRRNVPETVAWLSGGEYFKLTDARSLERNMATIANHMPNRYLLSFHPQSPHPGLHVLTLKLPNYEGLKVTARTSYWADPAPTRAER